VSAQRDAGPPVRSGLKARPAQAPVRDPPGGMDGQRAAAPRTTGQRGGKAPTSNSVTSPVPCAASPLKRTSNISQRLGRSAFCFSANCGARRGKGARHAAGRAALVPGAGTRRWRCAPWLVCALVAPTTAGCWSPTRPRGAGQPPHRLQQLRERSVELLRLLARKGHANCGLADVQHEPLRSCAEWQGMRAAQGQAVGARAEAASGRRQQRASSPAAARAFQGYS
jgi:hypothetical protein